MNPSPYKITTYIYLFIITLLFIPMSTFAITGGGLTADASLSSSVTKNGDIFDRF